MSETKPLFAPLKPEEVSPRLWAGGRFVKDEWRNLVEDEQLPIAGKVLIPLGRWRQEQTALLAVGVPLGLRLAGGDSLEFETDDVERFKVIALPFPKFSDGRSYSTARRLREAGYKGELRATGDVLIDQIPLMLRAGFDAFEVTHAATVRALESGHIPLISRVYQSGAGSVAESVRFARRSATALIGP
jgi:phosphoadenosine phosphosulfate reductase